MNGSQPVAQPPGWYVDPAGRAELRFWTGQEWAPWVWDGTTVVADPHPIRRPLNRSDLGHLEFIDEVFLPAVRATGQITPNDDARLRGLLRQLTAEASGVVAPSRAEAAPVTTPVPAPAVTPTLTPAQPPAPAQTPHPTVPSLAGRVGPAGAPSARVQAPRTAPEPANRRPDSAFSSWWARTVQAVGTDLAVHGIAYLGVALFFVGAFGLVVFAFGDVTPGLRPLAELVIALAPFVAGAMLLKRRAITVGRALEVLGGILLPIMVLTSLVVTKRLDALGLRASCTMDEFWPIALQQFSVEVKDGAGGILFDGSPVVSFDDWLVRAKQVVGMIDDGKGPPPAQTSSPS